MTFFRKMNAWLLAALALPCSAMAGEPASLETSIALREELARPVAVFSGLPKARQESVSNALDEGLDHADTLFTQCREAEARARLDSSESDEELARSSLNACHPWRNEYFEFMRLSLLRDGLPPEQLETVGSKKDFNDMFVIALASDIASWREKRKTE